MAKKLILSGRVQGVFCRYYCSQNARRLGLKGSATNLYDGTVQVLLDTDNEDIVNKFIEAIRFNPYNFRFYGSITSVTTSDYSGPIYGDYEF
jgi:acylphosphatase